MALTRLRTLPFLALAGLLLLAAGAHADTRAAWSPDGKTIALTVADLRETRQWISFWSTGTGQHTGPEIRAQPDARFTNPAFSHDGRMLAVGRERGKAGIVMQVFDVGYGAQQLQFNSHEASAEVLGFNSDDSMVLVHLASGVVAAVAMNTGQQRTGFGHADFAALSPDGRWLGMVTRGHIQILDLSGQQDPFGLELEGVSRLAFSLDGLTVAALSPAGITAWGTQTGKLLYQQGLRPAPDSTADATLAFSSDRRSLLARVGDHLYVLDREVGGISKVIDNVQPGPVLLSDPAHPERVLAGGGRRPPLFWNVYFGGHQPFSLDSATIRAAALSPDGQYLVAGLSSSLGEIGLIHVMRPNGGKTFDLPGVTRSLGFAGPDLIAADDGRGRVLFWSLGSQQLQNRIDYYCTDGESRLVGASARAGTVLLRCDHSDGSTSSQLRDSKGQLLQQWNLPAIGMSPSGQRLAFTGDGGLDMLYLQNGGTHKLRGPERYHADRVAFSSDESHMIAIDAGIGIVYFFTQDSDNSYQSLAAGYTGAISAEALGPDMRQFLAVGDGGLQNNPLPVRRWDLVGDHRSFSEYNGVHTARIVALLLQPDLQHFITASSDNTLRLWEMDGASHLMGSVGGGNNSTSGN